MSAGSMVLEPLALWARHHDQRLEWAFRAYRRFIDGLSAETREHLAHSDGVHEPYVVVYGKTQVGKTTLLLDLMGIHGQAMPRVSLVLRGHRQQGKSATATVMEYRRSPDAGWQLKTGTDTQRFQHDREMTTALAEVRQAMSRRRLHSDAPVVVWIPCDCFKDGPDETAKARMLDLPGDNPTDDIERRHVQQMAERYVPHADLILLVGRGDDLSFLNPEALELPSIEDWQFVPNRFRIVTTYSFTPESVRNLARLHDGELLPALFRQRLLEQIRTFGLKLSEEGAQCERYFPLEFGDSWDQAAQARNPLIARLTPVVDELKRQLHADIQASATESARFRNALDVHVVARRKKEACLEQGRQHLEVVDEQLSRLKRHLDQAALACEHAEKAAERTQALVNATPETVWRATLEKMITGPDIAPKLEAVASLGTKTGHLFACINEFTSWLTSQFLNMRPVNEGRSAKFWGAVQPNLELHRDEVAKRIEAKFSSLRSRMRDYWKDEYYPSVSSSFSDDKSRLRGDMQDAAKAVGEIGVRLWTMLGQQRACELLTLVKEDRARCRSLQESVEYQERERARLFEERRTVQRGIDTRVRKLEGDESGGARFRAMLDEEYLTELQQLQTHAVGTSSSVEAFMGLLAAAALGDERQKILIGMQ